MAGVKMPFVYPKLLFVDVAVPELHFLNIIVDSYSQAWVRNLFGRDSFSALPI